ncbi:ORF6C domain-containing protein [Cohnella kolymensis]|uniref:ORF6C domain-containing protein n=1 Tax=Cohnella kolymensis TaxID=1590652 RepID=UPI0006983941|nr:ORF6C domain-containing protein [Cohnella kolymensis]
MKDSNVIEFAQKTIQNSEDTLAAMKAMLEQVVAVSNETKEVREEIVFLAKDVHDTRNEISQFEKEFRDTNRLLPSEVDDVYKAVVDRSIEIAKFRHKEDDEKFKIAVGKYRRMIWSKLKKRFGTSKYIHIKRMDYVAALMFIETFDPEDYI